MQRWQQQCLGVHKCAKGNGAYNLGQVMGQYVEIIEIYRRYRYYRAFPGQTATRYCICYAHGIYLLLNAYISR